MFLYSLLFAAAFLMMLPVFYFRRQKYAAGFRERLGNYPAFRHDGREVIWLHCVSVGETNAARPLVNSLREAFPSYRLVVSTTTKTGQELARNIFKNKADAVFYFPFDFKFSVRKALENYKPAAVLMMETEIWPRFYREAHLTGAKIAIVNGRLSARSFGRYSRIKGFIAKVLSNVDLALMQGDADADRVRQLGIDPANLVVTGNLKFDHPPAESESLTEEMRSRFGITSDHPLIVAASTHHPEEEWILEAFAELLLDKSAKDARLLIAPRHPERFATVESAVRAVGTTKLTQFEPLSYARRSSPASEADKSAQVILLDSIGELRAVYPLAEIVVVGGSLIPHGGQSVLEPAAAGRAIITGPYTHNFEAVIKEFLANRALIQLPAVRDEQLIDEIFLTITDLLEDTDVRRRMGNMAAKVMEDNRGATERTIELLSERLLNRQRPAAS